MHLPRRTFLQLAAGAAALPAASRIAAAQAYPARPVHWIVGYTPGGGNDIIARLMAQWLQDRLGQSFVIENRPGAASNIATDVVVKAAPDGYTLLLINFANAANTTMYKNLRFDFIRDILPVAGIVTVPNLILVGPSVPAKTLPEFIAFAKANPGKVTMASSGIGSTGHLAQELLKMMTGIDLVHVPYRGGAPALSDLIAGQVQVMFSNLPAAEYIRAGKLHALAVTTAARSDELPDVPAVGEFVPGYEASAWYGLGAPRGTPIDIIEKLNGGTNAALADPRIKARLAEFGGTPLAGSPADFGTLVAAETEKWGKVVTFAGLKPD